MYSEPQTVRAAFDYDKRGQEPFGSLPIAPADLPLSQLMRERTSGSHSQAERSGFIADILHRKADRRGYALFLRNLLPAYEQLEQGLMQHADHPVIEVFVRCNLARSAALRADLARIHGADWECSLELLEAGSLYADCIAQAALTDGLLLVPHAYVRYFGDLSGGQVLKRLIGKSLSLPAEALTFYDFAMDAEILKDELRDAIDLAGTMTCDLESLIAETTLAFEHNIRVSVAVQANLADAAGATPRM